MDIRKYCALAFAILTAAGFSACGVQEDSSAEKTSSIESVSAPVESTEESQEQQEEQEGSYMEKCGEMLVELDPYGITKEREGVTYPEFEKHYYYSNTAERDTPVNVLLPAEYSEEKEYPVLYILHGYWDNEDWMARDQVHISTMLTNLIADGEAEEMIVVLPYNYTSKDMPYCTGMDEQNTLNYDNFVNDMMTDLMPFIESEFSCAKGRENTAITGFSMGGRESLFIGITHADKFAYIGAVCPAPGLCEGVGFPPFQLKKEEMVFGDDKPDVLLISGSLADGVVGDMPNQYDGVFTENGVEHIFHQLTETAHDASSVTPHLYNYLRMIFRKGK